MRKMKRMREIKRIMRRRRRRKRRKRRRRRKRRKRRRRRRKRKRKRKRSRTRRRTWEKEVPVLLRICAWTAFCSLPLFNQGDTCVVQVYGSDGVCVSSF